MNNATLIYKIPYNNDFKELKLEKMSLFLIDRITSSFKNDDDFIKHYYNKEEINHFIKEYGNIRGNLVIDYKKNVNEKTELLPLYDKEKIFLEEDYYNNQITEIEKARKLLFNSKNQLFVKLVLKSDVFKSELNRMIDLNSIEAKYAKHNNIKVEIINNKYYVSFSSLLKYRISVKKLGLLRNVYQDMLDILKQKLNQRDKSTIYYYNREFRLLINKYQSLLKDNTSISHIKTFKINKKYNYILCKEERV